MGAPIPAHQLAESARADWDAHATDTFALRLSRADVDMIRAAVARLQSDGAPRHGLADCRLDDATAAQLRALTKPLFGRRKVSLTGALVGALLSALAFDQARDMSERGQFSNVDQAAMDYMSRPEGRVIEARMAVRRALIDRIEAERTRPHST